MRWKRSDLVSSLKGGRSKDVTSGPEPVSVQIQTPAQIPDEENRKWWHNEIKVASDVLSFLTSGFPVVTPIHIQSLQQSTTFYLSGFQKGPIQPPPWNDILNSLIAEHAILESSTLDVAVIACLHALSVPAVARHVLTLVKFEAGRYLRCITLAARIQPTVVSHRELQSVDCLLRLNPGRGRDYEDFKMLLDGPGMAAAATFLRPSVIQAILAQSGISQRLNSQLAATTNPKQITSAISMINSFVRTGDASCCKNWLAFLGALDCQASLGDQVDTLVTALSVLSAPRRPADAQSYTEYLVDRLLEVLPAAQAMFCSQLETGAGEFVGMLIYELGNAVQQATWIHQDIPPSVLSQIQRFPSQSALEAIFVQLQDISDPSDAAGTRLKSYLATSIGGVSGTGTRTMAVAAIREEVEFWKIPPDTVRADLAKTLSKLHNLDYSLYTSCLIAMLKEDDEFIGEVKRIISMDTEEQCLRFSNHLAHRRRLNQLQDNCWLMLLDYLVRKQDRSYLPRMADSMSLELWLTTIRSLANLFGPMRNDLSQSGNGLTRDRLDWWQTLEQYVAAIRHLLEMPGPNRRFTWIFFPGSQDRVLGFLMTVQETQTLTSHRNLLSCLFVYLASDGNNLELMTECIFALKRTSAKGIEICERVLSRKEGGNGNVWSTALVTLLLAVWIRRPQLQPEDKAALEAIRKVLNLSSTSRFRSADFRTVYDRFQTEYEALIERAKQLEALRHRMQYQNRTQLSALLEQLSIEDTSRGRNADAGIPNELLDAVDLVGDSEYEISFLLAGLSDLQRTARGIPATARVLLLRIDLKARKKVFRKVQSSRPFDISFYPNDGGSTAAHSLFKRYLVNNLSSILNQDRPSVAEIHSATERLIADSPATCLYCSGNMPVKLWKASTCSINCTNALRKLPLEIRLHQLLVDPASIDLLLTSIYHAAVDTNLKLLPGCPISNANLRGVIDSFPPLVTLQTATDLQAAIRGRDRLGNDREKLLSWICLRFRGFMLTAPDGFRIPSMPHTQQFLLPNVHHEREQLFNAATAYGTGSGVVFHGTQCARLFLILSEGLKNMSGTQFQANGAASGPGVYCADEQYTSWSYSGATGQSWKNSTLSNMQVMLGCELKGYTPAGVHVITDDARLLVRYVFLLPAGYQTPARAHVEPAMSVAFAKLRSGLLT